MNPSLRPSDELCVADLAGVWRQRSLTVGDDDLTGAHHAVWVQAGGFFGDVRVAAVAGTEPIAFTGEVAIHEGVIAFLPALELSPQPDYEARIRMGIGEMLEFGTVHDGGAEHDFEEWWEQVEGPGPWSVHDGYDHHDDGRLCARVVQVGAHATVHEDHRPQGEFRSALWRYDADAWTAVLVLGGASLVPGGTPSRPAPPTTNDLRWRAAASGDDRRAPT